MIKNKNRKVCEVRGQSGDSVLAPHTLRLHDDQSFRLLQPAEKEREATAVMTISGRTSTPLPGAALGGRVIGGGAEEMPAVAHTVICPITVRAAGLADARGLCTTRSKPTRLRTALKSHRCRTLLL